MTFSHSMKEKCYLLLNSSFSILFYSEINQVFDVMILILHYFQTIFTPFLVSSILSPLQHSLPKTYLSEILSQNKLIKTVLQLQSQLLFIVDAQIIQTYLLIIFMEIVGSQDSFMSLNELQPLIRLILNFIYFQQFFYHIQFVVNSPHHCLKVHPHP